MIKVNQVSRAYGDALAVNGVSFSIPGGQIVGLLGHNGAGKTTIMKMLSGYLEPSAGSIIIDDIDLEQNPRQVQQVLGYLPENLPVYPDMCVADYLDYAATLKGLRGTAATESLQRAIRDTELQARLSDRISTLSRGYKQRVGVAQAILGSPKVLILDEPTNGLDPAQTQHMRDLIKGLAATATIILSTHIMQEVDAICDRALILNQGQLALDESLQDLRNSGHLRLRTDLDSTRVQTLCRNLPGLLEITQTDLSATARWDYRIGLADHADAENQVALVAAAVLAEGGRLFHIAAEVRDLETVFRSVNQSGGVANAA